jgi:hypothetical protein
MRLFTANTKISSYLIILSYLGYVFDRTDNYDVPFLVSGSLEIVAGIIFIVLAFYRKVVSPNLAVDV